MQGGKRKSVVYSYNKRCASSEHIVPYTTRLRLYGLGQKVFWIKEKYVPYSSPSTLSLILLQLFYIQIVNF